MIDVHVITLPNDDKILFERCIDSLRDEPVTVHIIKGVVGDFSAGRISGLSSGTHRWVSWVDPDDYVIPGAYQRLLDIVGSNKFAWAAEKVITTDATLCGSYHEYINNQPHHMMIIDRDLINFDHIKQSEPTLVDYWTRRLKSKGVFDPQVGYVWRSYGGMSIRSGALQECEAHPPSEVLKTTSIDDAINASLAVEYGDVKFIWYNHNQNNRIDCHILVHHSLQKPELLRLCLESVPSGMNILLAVDRTANKHIGSLRKTAMLQGDAEFLCFIDDDDVVVGDHIGAITHILDDDAGKVGVYTNWKAVNSRGQSPFTTVKSPWSFDQQCRRVISEVLHLHVFRRKAVMVIIDGLSKWDTAEEAWLMLELTRFGDWHLLDVVGYEKRDTQDGAASRITNFHVFELGRRIRQLRLERGLSPLTY